jgi:outer membrane protein assembly factor BamD
MFRLAESAGVGRQATASTACDKDMAVGRYYVAKRDYTAAVGRLKGVVTHCPMSSDIPEALAHLTKILLALGITSQAQTAAAVLERKFPSGQSTIEARDALRSVGLEPAEDEKSWIALAFQ